MDIKTLKRRIYDYWCICIGEMLFFFRKKRPGYSTGVCGNMTCGYGRLGFYGYWQYPVPAKNVLLDVRKQRS